MKSIRKLLFLCLFILFIYHIHCHLINKHKTILPQYNLTQSIQTAKFAALAFCPKTCIQNWNCHASKQFQFLSPTHISDPLTLTAGFIGYRSDTKTIIISWRGSSNKQNWYQDFNFEMIPFNKCKDCNIHAGFYFDFMLLQTKIYQKIDSLIKKYQVLRIVCTGHSLGGALTLISGIEIKLKYGDHYKVQVHNFGQPRIGDANLAQFIHLKLDAVFRVVHNKDIVPHVPFQFVKYVHTPYEVFFDAEMKKYVICNESGEDPKCSNQFFPFYQPHDHDFYFFNMPEEGVNCKVSNEENNAIKDIKQQ